jgi:hypothetical protein
MPNALLTKDRTLIGFDKLPGDFDTCSDPSASRDIKKFRRASNAAQESVGGRLSYDNITITRIWDETRDAAILRQFKLDPDYYNGGTLTLTGLGSDGVALGAPDTYTGIVESMSRSGSDANSGDEAKLTVVLAVAAGA